MAAIVGHLVGLGAGVAAVLGLGAAGAPPVPGSRELVGIRVAAGVIAAALTMLGLAVLRASQPPAAATMLLMALGGFEPTWQAAGIVIVRAVLAATIGGGVRFLRRGVVPRPRDWSDLAATVA